MSEKSELDVLGVSYAGPHSVQADIYTIEVHVQPTAVAPWGHIALRVRPAEATFLAHVMQSNPPRARLDDHLMEQVAAHDT
jgi:hypothetical protein